MIKVSDKDDIWALGVTTLYLLSGEHPFETASPSDDDAKSLKQTLQPLAELSQEAVDRRLEELGIEGQAFAFLRACLQVKPMKRKSIHELKSKGWITGNTATQMHREGKWMACKTSEMGCGV